MVKAFAPEGERLYFLAFLLDTGSAFLAKPSKEISKWLDMNSGEADSASAGLPAHQGRIHGRQTKKDNERKN
jgi:hypothetical protein